VTRRLSWIGLALIAPAVGLGFWPVHSEELNCGSVFQPTDFHSRSVELTQGGHFLDPSVPDAMCTSARSYVEYPAAILVIGGIIVLIVGVVVRRRNTTGPTPSFSEAVPDS
jgi:hypothetical protein